MAAHWLITTYRKKAHLLIEGVEPDDCWSKNSVDVVHGIEDSFAQVAGLIAIAQFNSFVDAGGGSAGHCSTKKAVFGGEVDLDGGVAAAVKNFASFNRTDGHLLRAGSFSF
jgi:hypothetical protein